MRLSTNHLIVISISGVIIFNLGFFMQLEPEPEPPEFQPEPKPDSSEGDDMLGPPDEVYRDTEAPSDDENPKF
jgi:hypothetical protein